MVQIIKKATITITLIITAICLITACSPQKELSHHIWINASNASYYGKDYTVKRMICFSGADSVFFYSSVHKGDTTIMEPTLYEKGTYTINKNKSIKFNLINNQGNQYVISGKYVSPEEGMAVISKDSVISVYFQLSNVLIQ